ncbi:MAG TPA: hypothetical protein VFA75_20105 [Nevskia sp.]|nr:hypothetical protein [Nevskia sp.]
MDRPRITHNQLFKAIALVMKYHDCESCGFQIEAGPPTGQSTPNWRFAATNPLNCSEQCLNFREGARLEMTKYDVAWDQEPNYGIPSDQLNEARERLAEDGYKFDEFILHRTERGVMAIRGPYRDHYETHEKFWVREFSLALRRGMFGSP